MFRALVTGLVARTGWRTVCGILVGARLPWMWAMIQAHRFCSVTWWSPKQLGARLAGLIVSLWVAAGEPLLVAVDDTLFRRSGEKVWTVSWFHDGSAVRPGKVSSGYKELADVVVTLPFVPRPACLLVLAPLVVKNNTTSPAGAVRRTVPFTPGPARA